LDYQAMKYCRRAAALLLAALLLLASATPATAQSIDTLSIRGHTRFLTDDLLGGRGTGTVGEQIAAAYIISQVKRLGLSHLPGSTAFALPVPLRAAHIHEASRVVVHAGSDSTTFSSGSEFIVSTGGAGAFRDFGGRAVFLGVPAHAAMLLAAGESRGDDGRSLDGTIAVFAGPLGAAALDIVPALQRAGVAGIVLLVPDAEQYDYFQRSRGDVRYFVAADVNDPIWQPGIPTLLAGPRLTDALLAGAVLPAGLLDDTAARAGDPVRDGAGLRPVDLGRTLDARIATTFRDLPATNVAAMLPGADPVLRNEYVVFTAHYDHLGIGGPDATGDSIYSGFSDNAAGVGMLLAIAETMRAEPPARSVLFLFFTGEERGLLGSTFFAETSPLALDRIRAVINLDAGAPPAPPASWRIAGGDTPLGQIARDVAASRGWTTALTPASPNSDHWPFLERGVPAIFIIPGEQWENVSAAERAALRDRWDRYHQPGDRWFADFPFAGIGRYAEFALLVGLDVANRR
jgi:hypothetical protein